MSKRIYRLGIIISFIYLLAVGYRIFSRLFSPYKPEYYELVGTISVFVALIYFLILLRFLRSQKMQVSYLVGIGFIFIWLAYKALVIFPRLGFDINPSEPVLNFLNLSYPISFIVLGLIIAYNSIRENRLLTIYGILTSTFYIALWVFKEFHLEGEIYVGATRLFLFIITIVIYLSELRKLNAIENDILDNNVAKE